MAQPQVEEETPEGDPFTPVIRCAHRDFPDFRILEPGGTLRASGPAAFVRSVRLEIPGPAHLTLQAVSFRTRDGLGPADLAEVTELGASGWYRRPPELRRLLDFDDVTHPNLATRRRSPAWVEFDFAHPLEIEEVVLRNLTGPAARRMAGLTITATTEDGAVITLYDARRREEQLRAAVADLVEAQPVTLDESARELVDLTVDLVAGRYVSARRRWQRVQMSRPLGTRFRAAISSELLHDRELEWTAHGADRSFRFWPAEEIADYVSRTVALMADLTELSPDVCLGFGAVLAAVRDGHPIPHDDDLDVIIAFEPDRADTLAAALELIGEHLTSKGYKVSGGFAAHRHVTWPGGPRPVDVFVGLFEGDEIGWFPGTRRALHRDALFPPSSAQLSGVECPLPRDPNGYLETIYGRDWRTPDPNFRHRWRTADYADQLGRAGGDAPRPGTAPRRSARTVVRGRLARLLRRWWSSALGTKRLDRFLSGSARVPGRRGG